MSTNLMLVKISHNSSAFSSFLFLFLADPMQYDRLLAGYCHLWRCALWLNDTSYSKCLNKWIGSAA